MNKARNNGIYAAETILKQRTKDGKVWYLMKWKGYSPRFNTWEPEENVLDDRLLKAYRKRLAESKGRLKRKRAKTTEEEGNPSDEKGEVDVDVEITDATLEAAVEAQNSREETPVTSVEKQPAESMRKWRKRRKHNPDTTTEVQKDEVESNSVAKPSVCTGATDESTEIKENIDAMVTNPIIPCSPEPQMTELSVEIPDDEHAPKSLPTSLVLEEAIDPQQQARSLETPTSSSPSIAALSETDIPATVVKDFHSSPVGSPKQLSPESASASTSEERKIDLKNTQQEKKHVMTKSSSSHFDFLANSIIITDVTTERGTVTVKECSAYGDFFGPDLDKPH